MEKVITLSGTVTAFEWFNPHAVIQMDVKAEKAKCSTGFLSWPPHPHDPHRLEQEFHEAWRPDRRGYSSGQNGATVGTTGVQYNVLKVLINGVPLPTR